MAVYAATLPVLRRRALYAEFLGGLNGEENRREALRQAKEHLSGDVSAILKKAGRGSFRASWVGGVSGVGRARASRQNTHVDVVASHTCCGRSSYLKEDDSGV